MRFADRIFAGALDEPIAQGIDSSLRGLRVDRCMDAAGNSASRGNPATSVQQTQKSPGLPQSPRLLRNDDPAVHGSWAFSNWKRELAMTFLGFMIGERFQAATGKSEGILYVRQTQKNGRVSPAVS